MKKDFYLPDIGEGIVECELVEWLVQEGDHIHEDQAVCDVMTDKALVQIPAVHAGVVSKLYVPKGELARVHAPLFEMELEMASGEGLPSAAQAEVRIENAAVSAELASGQADQARSKKVVASPAVRRLAREMSVDLTQVTGSGDKGRVYKEDIHAFVDGTAATPSEAGAAAPESKVSLAQGGRVEPLKGIKAAMARQMAESAATIPHFTYCDEIALNELVALRERLKSHSALQDIKLTMLPFFIKALSLALKDFPILNSRVNDACSELTYLPEHNIGVAVDADAGLLVPNIKQCEHKSILDIARELARLTASAREGRVSPTDLRDGTITLSNVGAIGGTVATPIINKPEVAIVALGRMRTLPRFNEQGEVVASRLMQVSWSGDHRVIDGATMARFSNLWKQYLEQPELMLATLV
ncbi:2-oxo acid dehydrogenase subunit E2 [Zobellella maritima]|uniref:2-oxo acid dehydrogenase subunit E2 n=1 Tax=Zobellella maritima TaxID=2059725 RepID=UPI000E308440|nr:2-oxo acid dehydrogenase subunit E2 [Zobellella maritima]